MNRPSDSSPPQVLAVRTRRDLGRFIDLPGDIYADDPAWIPPLRIERRFHFSRFNPFIEHGRWQAWVALKEGRPVGRISAQVDDLHRERYGANTGHFGLLEAVEDPAVVAELVRVAETWLRRQGTRRVTGPFNFSINQECGLLVEGFETPPVIMMPHGRQWYAPFLEQQGYLPAQDLLAYRVNVDFRPPPVMRLLSQRYGQRVKLRTLRRRRLVEEMEILRDIFNDAWSLNWGFVPFTAAEFAEFGRGLRLFVPDEFVQIAELDGEPVAFIVALPNLNEALKDLGGRLLPSGWFKLWLRLKRRQIRTGRVPLMGVRKRFQNRPIGMALAFLVIGAVKRELLAGGIEEVEMSWILEGNSGMRNILDSIGSTLYKRYRIYEKELS